MILNDKELDLLKSIFDKYLDYESFEREFLIPNDITDREQYKEAFLMAQAGIDSWETYKFACSTDSLRLYKELDEVTVDNIIAILNTKDLSKYKRVLLILDNKDYPGLEKLNKYNIDILIEAKGYSGFCTVDEFVNMRDFLNSFMETYHPENLSQLEKITLAYDHSKFFEYNKETNEREIDSRNIAKILKTGFIICHGFSNVFCQLLLEMGIKSNIMYTYKEQVNNESHANVILYVDDPKYNIHGCFIFDPTYDSSRDLTLVEFEDGDIQYLGGMYVHPDDKVLDRYPSAIQYNFYLMPANEFKKYFPQRSIEKILKYPSGSEIKINEEVLNIFGDDYKCPKDQSVINVLPEVLTVTKKIEGYNQEEIDKYISDVLAILKKMRFGVFDSYSKK